MKLEVYQSSTIYESAKFMLSKIDGSDFFVDNIIVVPDKYSLLTEKMILNLSKEKSLFTIRVKTLSSLSTELLSKLGVRECKVISSGESLLLTQQAIENVKKDFVVFKKNNINFCHEINKIISQFKSSGVEAEELKASSSGKYHDLSLIYSEYQRLLIGSLDANERLKLLKTKLESSEILSKTRLYFAHFDAFTKEALEFIWVLFEKSDKVAISLAQAISIGNEYIYEKDLSSKFEKIANEKGVLVDYYIQNDSLNNHQNAIVKGLYSYESVKQASDGYYNIYGSGSLQAEVESVAKLIRYYTYQGNKYSDFQIAVGEVEKYQGLIEQIFDRYDIPYYIDSSITADKTILGNFIIELFSVVVTGYSKDNLIDLFANILLNQSGLIDLCQKYNIEGRGKYKQFLQDINPLAEEFVCLENAKKAGEFSQIIKSVYEKVFDSYSQVLETLQAKEYLKEFNINKQAKDVIEEILTLIEKYSQEDMDCREYLNKLKLLLSFKQVYTVPTYLDSVMVGDSTQSGYEEKPFIIILGAESFPIVSSDNGLLSDEELFINDVGKVIEPSIRMINRRNRFKLFNLLSLAKDGLYLFYQITNSEGKRNELPAYAKSLNQIFNQKPLNVRGVFFAENVDNEKWALLASEPEIHGGDYSYLSREGKLQNAEDLLLKNDIIRVTQLENYFVCPFKHFANYGLKLKETFREFDPRFMGNVCHKMAEIFVKQIIMKGKTCDVKNFVEKNIEYVLEAEGVKEKIEYLDEKDSLIGFIKKHMISLLNDIIFEKDKSKFTPKHIEVKFDNLKLGKYKLIGKADRIDEYGDYLRVMDYKTGNTGNLLKGLYYGEKIQLFLYQKVATEKFNKKCGGVFYFNAKFNYSKGEDREVVLKGLIEKDDELILATDKTLDLQGKSQITNITRDSKGFKGTSLSSCSINKLCDYAVKVGENAVEEIKEGFISPKPTKEGCEWCPFKALCQYEIEKGIRANKGEPEF